jgi:penicillin-binding protein 1C
MRRIAFSFFIALYSVAAWPGSNFNDVKAGWRPSDTVILDRHGELLHRLRTNHQLRRGQWVALADVSPALRTALVLSEDKRFYQHSGVDWQAVTAAAWANLFNRQTRGASTITMQLAGLLDTDLKRSNGGRSMLQKVKQTVSAEWLEQRWRKDQILEAYLNLLPYRGELVGIDALSQTLFGKAPHGLDEREAAIAAALVRAPNAAPAQVAQRACAVLAQLQPTPSPSPVGGIGRAADGPAAASPCPALAFFTSAVLQRRDYASSSGVAPHLAHQLLQTQRAARTAQAATADSAMPAAIRTTLHAPLQRFAVQTLQQHLRELRGRQVEDAALLVLDNPTGEVLAWVGSSGDLSAATEVDGVTALRQPGSTLKPFLYAQAIAQHRLTAASLLEDSSAQLQTSGGLYIPQNYDRQFKGWVSVRTALAASLNVPAVRTLVMVSPNAFHRQLRQFGLPLKETGDYYGYSLALGSAEVPLLALTNAYRTLANGGRLGPVRIQARPAAALAGAAGGTAIDARAAFIVSDILSDPLARAPTFGLDSVLATRFWSAVKTGTSKDMRDNWAVGYSQRYSVGVWVGNASGAAMHDVSGTTGAAPIWAAVMQHLHDSQASRAPKAPAGLVRAEVGFAGIEAPRSEWFLSGTQQSRFTLESIASNPVLAGARGKILTPTNGTIIALDPDMPPQHQRLRLSAAGQQLQWLIDGKPYAKGATAQWLPWPGKHRLQLADTGGKVLDEVQIEVRGAGVKAATRQHGQ